MDKKRRQKIREVIRDISIISSRLDVIKDEEDDTRVDVPENLQSTEQYETSELCSDIMGDAISDLNQICENLEEIT